MCEVNQDLWGEFSSIALAGMVAWIVAFATMTIICMAPLTRAEMVAWIPEFAHYGPEHSSF
jgi:hypothetical protein